MQYSFNHLNDKTEFSIDDRVTIGSNVTFGQNCKKINIGYGTFLGNDIYIDVPVLSIGEYTTVHRGTTIHGYKDCSIGHNCWIGQFCIIDSIGGTSIGNNVGVGANSQLWSHIKFGDRLEGCRFYSSQNLVVEDDVWFVGHCIVSPILAKKKSMLLSGGVITQDMEANHIYGGSPAKDISDKLGFQFEHVDENDKMINFKNLYLEFLDENNISNNDFQIDAYIKLADYDITKYEKERTIFFIKDRKYIPTRSQLEFKFMKYLLYDKGKFVPISN